MLYIGLIIIHFMGTVVNVKLFENEHFQTYFMINTYGTHNLFIALLTDSMELSVFISV